MRLWLNSSLKCFIKVALHSTAPLQRPAKCIQEMWTASLCDWHKWGCGLKLSVRWDFESNTFTQCWRLHGFIHLCIIFLIHKTFLRLGSHLFSSLNRWSVGKLYTSSKITALKYYILIRNIKNKNAVIQKDTATFLSWRSLPTERRKVTQQCPAFSSLHS